MSKRYEILNVTRNNKDISKHETKIILKLKQKSRNNVFFITVLHRTMYIRSK